MAFRLAVFSVFLFVGLVRADLIVPADEVEFEPHITGDGEKMNYGPFLSYSLFGAAKEQKGKVNLGLLRGTKAPLFMRPINIHLGGKYWACFDTEMCAFGCAWAGGPPNISRSNLNGYKGADLAYLRLPAIFQNQQRPGWSLDGKFDDPRPTPHGALPKQIGHYKGLYLNGQNVTLSYTVGDAHVLDMAYVRSERGTVFVRELRINNLKKPVSLFLLQLPGAKGDVNKRTATLRRGNVKIFACVVSYAGGRLGEVALRLTDGDQLVADISAKHSDTDVAILISQEVGEKKLVDLVNTGAVGGGGCFLLEPPDKPRFTPRWKETITLSGQRGAADQAYTVDTIPLPFKNPWNSWMRPSGFDFFSDGRAAVCTWNGDVWIVSGIDDDLKKVTWRRHATGLFEPLGLKIVEDKIYVLGRDRITRLHDLNNDGEADYYENFNHDAPTAASYHSFAMDLHLDKEGNFYYSRGSHRVPPGTPMHGGIIKVAKDGSKAELICTGLREANGMCVTPDGLITAADNQGNWVPTSKIDIVRPGKFYGYPWEGHKNPPPAEQPMCWIPYAEDNSSGSQVVVTSDKWGPLKGTMLHTSYGTAKLFQVFMQRDGDSFQGGVSPFPLEFHSGIMRARFNPKDGQLYVCGLKGWTTKGKDDGGFYRVRYTGKPAYRAKALRVDKGKIAVAFTDPLDPASVKLDNVKVEQWNYRITGSYGSKDYSVADPKKEGRDRVDVKVVRLAEDRKTVVLEIPTLRPVMQMGIYLKVKAADGQKFDATVYNTINYLQ